MTSLINQTLLQLKADYYPPVTHLPPMPNYQRAHFRLFSYSIIHWSPDYYRGFFEVYHSSWDNPFFAPTLLEVFQYLVSLDPSIFYSPTLSPERFL